MLYWSAKLIKDCLRDNLKIYNVEFNNESIVGSEIIYSEDLSVFYDVLLMRHICNNNINFNLLYETFKED